MYMQKPEDRAQGMLARNGCRKGWLLLDRLCAKIGMVREVLEDGEGDELLGYNKSAALSICADVPLDEVWENVNPSLDRLLGFGRSQQEIVAMIRHGREGLHGFYEYLEVLVEQGGIVGGLLEGKIDALITAMAELRPPGITTRIPSPVPLPIPGTHNLPIEVIEMNEMTKAQDKPTTRTCSGAYLAMPDGVLPYSTYPFMLHEVFALPWDIHIVDHRLSIQSISCTGVRDESSDSCRGCSQLLTHRIVEAILH
ncbi:hypothetical protein EI94DRAFT_1706943 [Lactarius quietus]|nr:hypothetical protein EI94DRAFT_1706943 [Lactarius quietus]